MHAVGVLSSYISQGVYSVAGPFHPFGGVVDIIVVQQQDGSFKTSPWYVKFGKFQGVLKRREKVVEIEVNDVKAGFHMYLDHKGEAYFWQDVEGEGKDTMASPPSGAASSGDEAEVKAMTMGEGDSEILMTTKSLDTERAHLEKTESLPCPLHPSSKDVSCNSGGVSIDLTEIAATKGSDNAAVEKPDQRFYGLFRSKSQPDPPTVASAVKNAKENGEKLTNQQRAEIVTTLLDSNWGTAPPKPPDGFCDQVSASDGSIQASLSITSAASEDVLVVHSNDSGSVKDFELVQTTETSFMGTESSSDQDWDLQREEDAVVLFIQERTQAENLSGDGLICLTSNERLQQDNAGGVITQADPMPCSNDSNSEVILMSVDGHFVMAPMNLDGTLNSGDAGTPIESPSHLQITEVSNNESKVKVEEMQENLDTVLCVAKELPPPPKEVSQIPHYASAKVSADTTSEAGFNGTTTSTITLSNLSAQCITLGQHGLTEEITDAPSPLERYYSFKEINNRASDSDGDSDDEGFGGGVRDSFQSSPALQTHDDEASLSDANNGVDALPTSSATEYSTTMEVLLSGEASRRENYTQKPAVSENARDLPRLKSEPISIPGIRDTRKDLKIARSMPNKLDETEEQITEMIYSQSLDSPAASRLAYGNFALAFRESRQDQSNSDVAESSLGAVVHSLDHNNEDNTHENGQADAMQQANFSQGTNFHAGVEISLCKHLLKEGMGTEAAAKAFASKKVTPEEFKRLGPGIVANDKLVVKFGECYFPWSAAAHAFLGMLVFGIPVTSDIKGAIPVEGNQIAKAGASGVGTTSGGWSLWPFIFRKSKPAQNNTPSTSVPASAILAVAEVAKNPLIQDLINTQSYYNRPRKAKVRMNVPTSEQLASLNLKEGANKVTFVFSTAVLGKQQVDARIYLWKWNTKIVISDVDGTITKSDVLGQVMPLMGKDWSQSGVTRLFSSIKDNGYELLFLSARAISQAYLTRQFLVNLKQDGETLPDGPVVISPDGLFPSLYREVIRRAPHEFKISCLEGIRELFPPDVNPFYAGFGNRDTDELSYLKVGIPRGKIFIINPKGEVVVNHRVDAKTYTSLHTLVHDIFPPVASFEQEDYNSWNYWKLPLPTIDEERNDKRNNTQIVKK